MTNPTDQDVPMIDQTNLEKVALAIQTLTYSEMMDLAGSIRDIFQDRISDDPEALADIDQVASALHSWAVAETSDVA